MHFKHAIKSSSKLTATIQLCSSFHILRIPKNKITIDFGICTRTHMTNTHESCRSANNSLSSIICIVYLTHTYLCLPPSSCIFMYIGQSIFIYKYCMYIYEIRPCLEIHHYSHLRRRKNYYIVRRNLVRRL